MKSSTAAHAWRGYVGLSLVWLAILGIVLVVFRRPSSQPIEILPPPTPPPTPAPTLTPTPAPLRVDVAGAVRSPGVYTLPPGSLVADAIAAAGGPADDADLDRLNKATPLSDGAQVYVPRINQTAPLLLSLPTVIVPSLSATPQAPAGAAGKLININTATLEELDALPGIGPATAQKIIEGRPYGTVEDLLRVKGIGQATFEKLKPLITVR